MWDVIEKNDYLTTSCGCPGGDPVQLWDDVVIDRLADDDPDAQGRVLGSSWCGKHGQEYCDAILAGQKIRLEAAAERTKVMKSQFAEAQRRVARLQREARQAHRAGLPR